MSYYKHAMKTLANIYRKQPPPEPEWQAIEVRIVGGFEGWSDAEQDELWQILDAAGSIDDSQPEGSDWVYYMSSADIDPVLVRLREGLSEIARPCQIVITWDGIEQWRRVT